MCTLRSDAALRLGYFSKAKGISKQVKEDCFIEMFYHHLSEKLHQINTCINANDNTNQ